jgi:hypothetical protein
MRSEVIGTNEDQVQEIKVNGMANDLVLLAMRQYASKGLFIANVAEGSILAMESSEAQHVIKTLREKYAEYIRCEVQGGVYEVVSRPTHQAALSVEVNSEEVVNEETVCHAYAATQIFNSKIAFSTTEEVITAYLMMGFSLQQLENIVRRELLTGIDPRITAVAIATYRKAHGSAPDFIQLAYSHVPGNRRACEGEPLVPTHAGHYVQVDEFRFDYNFTKVGERTARTEKIPSLGGATESKLRSQGS